MNSLTDKEKLCNLETINHIRLVASLLNKFASELIYRGQIHDESKLNHPEVEAFSEVTDKLANSTYGSPEYDQFKKKLSSALEHHYANNRHHPEHYPDGVNGMNLVDIVEMFCDWYAAGKRHNNGNIRNTLNVNKGRFNLSDQLVNIFENTIDLVE